LIESGDATGWIPTHYAAACENSENLEILMDICSASATWGDEKEEHAYTIAAFLGRIKSIEVLSWRQWKMVNEAATNKMSALGYASWYGWTNCAFHLVNNGAWVNSPSGWDKLTPIMWAVAGGHFEITQLLIEKGADIHAKDKFGWTALVYAVWNGHSKIAAMLLDYGITYEVWDLSGNAPLHYACAYGFKECVEVLLKAETELNALNDWKVAPISIAMMKNHTHIVTRLLEENSIDVNYMDDKGWTLLCLAMSSLTNEN